MLSKFENEESKEQPFIDHWLRVTLLDHHVLGGSLRWKSSMLSTIF